MSLALKAPLKDGAILHQVKGINEVRKKHLKVDEKKSTLVIKESQDGSQTGELDINLIEVLEIHKGWKTDIFNTISDYVENRLEKGLSSGLDHPIIEENCFSLIHSSKERKSLDLIACSEEERDSWVTELREIVETVKELHKYKSNLGKRLQEFVVYFVKHFEAKLLAYNMILEKEIKAKAGKLSNSCSEGAGYLVGGALGFGVGAPFGFASQGATTGAAVGKKVGKMTGAAVGKSQHTKQTSLLTDTVERFLSDKAKFRKELVVCGFDIFQSLEIQFMRLKVEGIPKIAMDRLARDAVARAVNHLKQSKDKVDSISINALLGESKMEKIAKLSKHPFGAGFDLKYKYKDQGEKGWNSATLYNEAGITFPQYPSYWKRIKGEGRTGKYGYRRLLIKEDWNDMKEKYELDKPDIQFDGYQYFLNASDLEGKSSEILKRINQEDQDLSEERLRDAIETARDDILTEITLLQEIEKASESDKDVLLEVSLALQNLNVKDYLSNFRDDVVRYHEEAKKEREDILNAIEDGFESLRDARSAEKRKLIFGVKPPVSMFTGRSEVLSDLHNKLKTDTGMVVLQAAFISGLGGIGKTELARKYILDHQSEYQNILWIDSDNRATLSSSFLRLADQMKIPRILKNGDDKRIEVIVDDVYNHLPSGETLFIFDNTENYNDIKDFLKTVGNRKCKFLVTSRTRGLTMEDEGNTETIDLGVFTPDEAAEFIKKGLGRKSEVFSEENEEEIAQLAAQLQYLPLALRQAVSYVVEKNKERDLMGEDLFTVSDYLQEYEKETIKLLGSEAYLRTDRYGKTVLTTWTVTIDKIKAEKYGDGAIEILNIISYLSPDRIGIKDLLKLDFQNKSMLTSGVFLLNEYSMINLKKGEISIHRLVQEATRIKIRSSNVEEDTIRKILELMRGFEESDHPEYLWRHAFEYDNLISQYGSETYGEFVPLQLAARSKDRATVDKLLLHNARVNSQSVAFACKDGDVEMFNLLLNKDEIDSLKLENSNLNDDRVKDIAHFLRSSTKIRKLHLGWNEIGDEGAKAIAKVLPKSTAVELNLNDALLSDEGAEAIGNVLHETQIKVLRLYRNRNIGSKGAAAIGRSLQKGSKLWELDMSFNQIGNEGFIAIANGLPGSLLEKLCLGQNPFGNEGIMALGLALPNNTKVSHVDLINYKVNMEGVEALIELGKQLEERQKMIDTFLQEGEQSGSRCNVE